MIPDLTGHGFLPPGEHECTLDGIRARFGETPQQRRRLFEKLVELLDILRLSRLVRWVYVDGSFVTNKSEPNDVDVIIVLPADHDFAREITSMAEYTAVNGRLLKRRTGFDVLHAAEGSEALRNYMEFFAQIRDREDLTKGILRVWP